MTFAQIARHPVYVQVADQLRTAVLAAVERSDGAAAVRHALDHILGRFRLIHAREPRS